MSFSAAVIILAVIVCRALLINKLPKKVFLALWTVALLRLLVPYSFPSILSIYSLAGQNQFIMEKAESIINYGKGEQEQKKNIKNAVTKENDIKDEVNKKAADKNIAGNSSFSVWMLVWLAGFIICSATFTISYILCYKRFCTSVPVSNEYTKEWLNSHKSIRHISIKQSGFIKSPLSYGNFRPVILMPETTDWEDLKKLSYILEHEFVHIKRFDTATKLFLIIAVCIHWFNPLVWVMYILLNRDIELACDETVIRHFGESSKAAYARVLIGMEEEKSGIAPLGSNFSKNAAEERIMAIMNIKKNSISVYIGAFLLFAVVVSVFATSAEGRQKDKTIGTFNSAVKETGESIIKDSRGGDEQKGKDFSEEFDNVLSEIAAKIAEKGDYQALSRLASFVRREDLDKIAKWMAEKGDYEAVIDLAPFLSEDVINEIVDIMADEEAYEELIAIAPFMSEANLSFGNY